MCGASNRGYVLCSLYVRNEGKAQFGLVVLLTSDQFITKQDIRFRLLIFLANDSAGTP